MKKKLQKKILKSHKKIAQKFYKKFHEKFQLIILQKSLHRMMGIKNFTGFYKMVKTNYEKQNIGGRKSFKNNFIFFFKHFFFAYKISLKFATFLRNFLWIFA